MIKNSLKKIIVLGIIVISVGYVAKNTIIDAYSLSSSEASADSISSEADFKFDATTGTITKYIGNQIEVVIPSTINGETVTSIGKNAFADCSKLIKITIPDCITSIGTNAFGNCVNLENILAKHNNKYYTSSDGVLFNKLKTEIIKYPEGKKDTSYIIPNSVASTGNGAFILSRNLTSITIPSSVTSIGERTFNGCSSLKSISIPDSVINIGDNAFGHCNNLISITIPSGVTNIGGSEFSDCINLASITIPNSVVSIGNSAFYGCSSLVSITIPSSVISIGIGAFYSCSSLASITIPNGATSIEKYAFYDCRSLTSITIPSSVTSIGCDAFLGSGNAIFYVESEKTKELLLQSDANSPIYVDSNKIVIK